MQRLWKTSAPIDLIEDYVIAAIAFVLAAGNVLLGCLLLFSSNTRFQGASYEVLRSIAPAHAWGAMFVTTGGLALAGQIWRMRVPAKVGHGFACVVCLIFVYAFIRGALANPNIGLTGIAAYLMIGIVHALIAKVSPPSPAAIRG